MSDSTYSTAKTIKEAALEGVMKVVREAEEEWRQWSLLRRLEALEREQKKSTVVNININIQGNNGNISINNSKQ